MEILEKLKGDLKMKEKITIRDMKEALEQYYEAAGFDSVYERELKGKTNEEIEDLYNQINKSEENK